MQSYYEHITETVYAKLHKSLGVKNRLAVPCVKKIVLGVGLSTKAKDSKYQENALATLQRISGQKPVTTKARKSISGFKVRQGMIVGVMVTLRGKRMYDFLQKLIHVALPRIRDFRGLPTSIVDGTGNCSIGFKEHLAFPEIRSDEIEILHGLQVTIVTTAGTHERGVELLKAFGFPFTS